MWASCGWDGVLNPPRSLTPPLADCKTTAMSAAQAPFLAEVELCGSAFPADPHWRCYNEPPVDAEGWLLPAFEDARWRPAAWAPRRNGVVGALPAAAATQFGRDAQRFVLPAPSLDQEAENAWNTWESAKESANAAWKKWRAAVEAEKKRNGTDADAVYVTTSMRGGDRGYNDNSTMSAQSNNTSLKWEDHAPNTTFERLEWHKPIPATLHSYFCRIELPNPAQAYALKVQQGSGSTKLKKGGASA